MLNKIKLIGSIVVIASSLVVANFPAVNTSQTIRHNQQLSHVCGSNRLEVSIENSGSFPLRFALSANGACLFGVGEPYNPNEKNGVIIISPKVNNVEATEIFLVYSYIEEIFQKHLKVFDMSTTIYLKKFECKCLTSKITRINPDLDPFYDSIIDLPLNNNYLIILMVGSKF